ncbi:MupG family TIM beta-alpha barrel fold protein [Avibacterium sp. 21-586]|uniref:DUF871 domain-containing protein n=1 Tax=Avibacterium sp. 21-586 TaxID=2911534 RepID=UPI0022459372|nr:MupG family TIM beta-alpha barrel fold protein [Avibacterium sp. 21-586]MCW9710197.1 MupG family TIM beta-alpha barrel fold protein [Avibacterium sp. 21-586]
MRQLGLSIYPEKSKKEDIFRYLEIGSKYNCKRIFTCLLSINKSKEEIIDEFKEIHTYAKKLGYEIIVDIAPSVFSKLDISYQDLSFFQQINVDGLRLDVGFSGNEEALMTYNPYGLKIEINMSNNVATLDTIMDYQPNEYLLCGCHNFYPHAYSGLEEDYFINCTKRFKKYGLRTAAFVTSQCEEGFGPWPVTQGLPTLEKHRFLPIDVQIKHFVALGGIDDILVSNCYVTAEEWQKIEKVRLDVLNFNVQLHSNLPEIERKIVLNELHINRGDKSANMIRSSQPRFKYKGHHFALFNTPALIKRGDIVVESSEYGHYAGELQIALKDMENSGKSNVVGRIVKQELFLLDYLKPWQKFIFTEE